MNAGTTSNSSQVSRQRSPDWQAAFRAQATMDLIAGATRFAAKELTRLRRHDGNADLSADDLLQNILTSTWEGNLNWNPDIVPLRVHVYDELQHACRREHGRLRRRSIALIAIDCLGERDPLRLEVEETLASNVFEVDHALAARVHQLIQELRRSAANDRDALKVLEALEQGHSSKLKVVEFTGLTPRIVDNATNRLRRIGRRISNNSQRTPHMDTAMNDRAPYHRSADLVGGILEVASSATTSGAKRSRCRVINNFEIV